MDKLRDNIWFAIALVFSVCLVVFTLSYIVIEPSHIIPELGGDGAKNIFTYLYHSINGHGYWFDGMNYPYGEHIVYTDGQPVLSVLLSSIGGMTIESALRVLWLLIGMSYVLSILYLFKILRHFKVAPLVALLFAGIIGIFTPQILRLQGHYALSYTCVIPMIFYWTIRYHDQRHWKYCLWLFITGCLFSFMHPYYAAMMLVWAGAYAMGYMLLTRSSLPGKLKAVAPMLLSAVGVLAVVAVVMKMTDPVKDRPATPFNTLYETCTRPKQLVTSYNSPVWQPLLKTPLKRYVSDGGEGYAYVGIVVLLTLGIMLLAGIKSSYRSRKLRLIPEVPGFSKVWLFMAFSILLFGMGIPFVWHMEWLMSYMAIFKQFRSLGRFSWIFYYIISIYTTVVIYQYFRMLEARGRRTAAYAVLIAVLAVWGYEVSGYISYTRKLSWTARYNYDMMSSVHEQNWPTFLAEHHYKNTDFQALLLLPFFHVGTEKLWVGYGNWLITLGSKSALQLQLPIVDVMMSRSSWGQAEKQVKIAGGKFVDRPMLRDLKSHKPLLLMRFDEDSLNNDERYLLASADYIGHYSQCHIYAFYPDRLLANDRSNTDSAMKIVPYMQHADTFVSSSGTCYVDHFDQMKASQRFFGTGAAPVITTDKATIATIPIISPRDSQEYEFSCWFLLSDQDPRAPNVAIEQIDANGKKDTVRDALTRQSTDNRGMWFRSFRYFYVHKNVTSLRCIIDNTPRPSYIAMDELMVRPADAWIISKGRDGSLLINNHELRRPAESR